MTVMATEDRPQFVTKCEAKFISSSPESPNLTLEKETKPYVLTTGAPNGASITFAGFTIVLEFSWIVNEKDFNDIRPCLELNFYKDNLYQDSINYILVDGLDFAQFPIGKPLNLQGISYQDMTVQGYYYSRVDYSCSITRVQ